MQPINYASQFVDPSQAVFEGYATGLNFQGARQKLAMNEAAEARARELHPLAIAGQELSMDAQVQGMELASQQNARANDANARAQAEFAAQQRAAAQARNRQQQFQEGMAKLAELGAGATAQDYATFGAQFPEFAATVNETWAGLDDAKKAGMSEAMGQAMVALRNGHVNRAISLMDGYAKAAENSGDMATAETLKGVIFTANQSPEAAMALIGSTLQVVDPQMAQAIMGGGGANVQRSDLIGGIASVQVMSDGSPRIVDTRTNKVVTGADAEALLAEARAAEAEAAGSTSAARRGGTLTADIELGGEAAFESARGSALGRSSGESIASAGSDVERAERSIDLIESIMMDPALKSVTGGLQGRLPAGIPLITGGQAGADLGVKIQQLQGQSFLQAFETLKGGGQITEREGQAATAAIARLQTAQSADAYRASLQELLDIMVAARDRAQGRQVADIYDQGSAPEPRRATAQPSYAEFGR